MPATRTMLRARCNTRHATRATQHAPCKLRRKTCRATCEIAHPWQGAGEECLLPAPSTAGHAGWPCRGGTRQGRPQEIQRATRGLSRTTTRQSPAGAVWSTITQTRKHARTHANTQTRKHARTHARTHACLRSLTNRQAGRQADKQADGHRHARTHTNTHTRMHTHTHTHTPLQKLTGAANACACRRPLRCSGCARIHVALSGTAVPPRH